MHIFFINNSQLKVIILKFIIIYYIDNFRGDLELHDYYAQRVIFTLCFPLKDGGKCTEEPTYYCYY